MKEQYLKRRLKSLGLTKKDITTTISIPKEFKYKRGDKEKDIELTYFTGDEKDNIQIYYYSIHGLSKYNFTKKGNKWFEPYIRTRIQNPTGDMPKYISPKGSGLNPFFSPELLKAYVNNETIETLVVTEGEFKAFMGCKYGFNVVGLPSIHGFYGNEQKGKIHDDIIDFIVTCKVKNIVFLTDADTLVIDYSHEKDLRKRQTSFFSSIKIFRENLEKTLNNPNTALKQIYFSHIKTKYNDNAKGLDDLLVKFKGKENEVLKDLLEFQFANKFFEGHIITDGRTNKLHNYFGLNNEHDFYKIYREYIGNREFRYGKRVYVWDGENVKYLQHQDTNKYMRIGADWMKEIELRNKHGQIEKQIIGWKIGEITRDYKQFPDFLDNVPKYDGFCSEPDFSPNYKRVHHDLMNIYSPCVHNLQDGTPTTTLSFLKHIFGGEATAENPIEGDTFTVALDYLTLQFNNPKQMLPVPVLVSKEFGTGKSTFLKWLQSVYVGNTAILNNDQFKMQFNSHYITKYIIAIDEGFLDVDKKAEKERIKQLATADTQFLQNKGIDLKPFPYFGKLIICSNDADNVMKMENGEDRWFVIKVPVPKTKNPFLEEELAKEIPNWLHFLANREVFHKKEDRFWFKKDHIITEQYNTIVKETKTRNEKVIEEFFIDRFLNYGVEQIKMTSNHILELLNKQIKYKMDSTDLTMVLEAKKGLVKQKRQRYKTPISIDVGSNFVSYENRNDRPYIFNHSDWLSEEEIIEFNKLEKAHQPF